MGPVRRPILSSKSRTTQARTPSSIQPSPLSTPGQDLRRATLAPCLERLTWRQSPRVNLSTKQVFFLERPSSKPLVTLPDLEGPWKTPLVLLLPSPLSQRPMSLTLPALNLPRPSLMRPSPPPPLDTTRSVLHLHLPTWTPLPLATILSPQTLLLPKPSTRSMPKAPPPDPTHRVSRQPWPMRPRHRPRTVETPTLWLLSSGKPSTMETAPLTLSVLLPPLLTSMQRSQGSRTRMQEQVRRRPTSRPSLTTAERPARLAEKLLMLMSKHSEALTLPCFEIF